MGKLVVGRSLVQAARLEAERILVWKLKAPFWLGTRLTEDGLEPQATLPRRKGEARSLFVSIRGLPVRIPPRGHLTDGLPNPLLARRGLHLAPDPPQWHHGVDPIQYLQYYPICD